MTYLARCPNCSEFTISARTAVVDRETGKPIRAVSLVVGLASLAFGIVLLWLGVSLWANPIRGHTDVNTFPWYWFGLGAICFLEGTTVILRFLKADKVRRRICKCPACTHQWQQAEHAVETDTEGLQEWATEALSATYSMTRLAAAEALAELGDQSAVEPLIRTLEDGKRAVRLAATEALGRIGDARALEPLTESLEDRDKHVREAASEALDRIKSRSPRPGASPG